MRFRNVWEEAKAMAQHYCTKHYVASSSATCIDKGPPKVPYD